MIIHSPGKETRSDLACPKVNLVIEGVNFMATPIILESHGLDLILGMDWLAKYKGQINCATRTITVGTNWK